MKAIIHIGMAKTGSTSIKEWLHSNRAELEANGVFPYEDMHGGFPRRAMKHAVFLVAQNELGFDEKTAWVGPGERISGAEKRIYENFKLLSEQLEKVSGKSGIFIFSSESLYRYNKFQIMALDKFLSRFFVDRIYVVYIRNTVDYFVSWYSQKLINNRFYECGTQDYSKFIKKCAENLVPYGLESAFGNLFDWKSVLGDRFNVRLLESDWLVNGDLIEDFASLAEVATLKKPARINESIAAEYIEYVRYFNLKFQDNLSRKLRMKALAILSDASLGKPKLAASDTQAKSIRDLHGEQEERIRNNFFPDRPFLFSPKFRGNGLAPTPLTESRKAKIEFEIRTHMAPVAWPPDELPRSRGCR